MKNIIRSTVLCGTLTLLASSAFAQNAPQIASFDGDDGMTFPRADSLDLDIYGAIEFWVKPSWDDDKIDDAAVISYMGPEGSRYAVIITNDKTKIGLLASDQWDWAPADFTRNRLRHVFINIFDEFSEVYLDGELAGTLLSGTTDVFANRLHIGSYDGTHLNFVGDMTGVRIWDAPLDEDLISKYSAQNIFGDISHPEMDALVGGSIWIKDDTAEGLSFKLLDETDTTVFAEDIDIIPLTETTADTALINFDSQ